MRDSKTSMPASPRRRVLWDEARLRWMYCLVVVPALTDLIETGRLPGSLREWITEIVAGVVIAVLVRKVRKEQSALVALARFDPLTGLWNRRAFEEAVEEDCARARRSRQPLSLVYIDLDNFKQINDTAGHEAGDRVLQQLAAAIRQTLRVRVDRGFRLGGDEFALLLPGTLAVEAELVVARIGQHCSGLDSLWVGGRLGMSAGIVELAPQEDRGEFVRRADAAMYRKKQPRAASAARMLNL